MMECIRIEMSNYNSPMNLAAKSIIGFRHAERQESGYAMAALLVALSVMAIVLASRCPPGRT